MIRVKIYKLIGCLKVGENNVQRYRYTQTESYVGTYIQTELIQRVKNIFWRESEEYLQVFRTSDFVEK